MPLGGVIFIATFILIFGALLLLLASKLGAYAPDPVKSESYECGIPVQEKKDTKISVKFYLTAILFVVFDIEAVFIYPWAVQFKSLGWTGLGSMFGFLSVVIVALVYVVKKGALEWES